jgi:hypothetical protein
MARRTALSFLGLSGLGMASWLRWRARTTTAYA